MAATLDARGPVVLPALLLCDFGHLAREVERLESAGAAALHLDVMDGRFVPQLTYGLVVVEAVRRAAKRPLEVHLMVGKGLHSAGGVHRLRAPVVALALETGFVRGREVGWDEQFGVVVVRLLPSLTPERRAEMLEALPGALERVMAKYCGRRQD